MTRFLVLLLFGWAPPVALLLAVIPAVVATFVILLMLGLDYRLAAAMVLVESLVVPRLPAYRRWVWGGGGTR